MSVFERRKGFRRGHRGQGRGEKKAFLLQCASHRGENKTLSIDTSCVRVPTSMERSPQLKQFPAQNGDLIMDHVYRCLGFSF